MDFDLTTEQRDFARMVHDFASDRIKPNAERWDREGRLPLDAVREMGDLGLFGAPFPEEYGGSGADFLTLCLAIEELARVDSSIAITLEAGVGLGAMPIYRWGTEDQKQELLPPLATGQALAGFGLTEAEAGSDAGATRTTARLEDGEWVVDGSKSFITNSGTDITSFVTITALTGEGDGRREISNIIVPSGTDGFEVGAAYRKMGWHHSDTHGLSFSDCRVPESNLLGERGAGYRSFLQILADGRIAIAALGVGLAQGCIDESIAYSKERMAFGQRIGSFQAIQFKIADMEVKTQLARQSYHRAAWLKEKDRPYRKEAAMAKLFSTEIAMDVAREAVQIHGGYGYIEEYPVCRHFRDAKVLEIGEGTSEMMRLIIARELGLPG